MAKTLPAILTAALAAAAPGFAQQQSQMTVGVQKPPPSPAAGPRFQDLSPAEQAEWLRTERERRYGYGTGRGASIDCGVDKERQPMTDLERSNWRLKCGK